MTKMIYNHLGNTGIKVSHVSMGGAAFSNIYGAYEEARGMALVKECFSHGVNYLETGPWYGQGSSEKLLGKALKDVPRESYYIASKVGRYDTLVQNMFDFSVEKTMAGVDQTLRLLGLDYVDFIQIHDVSFAPDVEIILKETLPTLERAVADGKCKYIGLADYDLNLMKDIFEESEVKISTILSYAKSTLFDNRLQNYVNYFKRNGVGVINAAATGMGLLTNKGPQSWHPAGSEVKNVCRRAAEYCKEQNVELARLATWFTLNQPHIDTNICGFFNVQQFHDTVNVLTKGLTDHEMATFYEVKSRFFENVTLHWDHVEVPVYRARLTQATAI